MERRAIQTYFYLSAGMVLLILVSFHYLTNFSAYWKQPLINKKMVFNRTTFEVLDYQQCPHRCHDALFCDNIHLMSISSVDKKAMFQLMKNFKPLNQCPTNVLIQQGKKIDKNWKKIISN